MAFTILTGDTFVSTGAAKKILLPSSADYVITKNITKLGLTTAACVGGEWFGPKFLTGASATNDGIRWGKNGSHAILMDNFSSSAVLASAGGFTYVTDSPIVEAQAANAITAITAANPAVVTQTNTYSEGDVIRIYNTTGMLQAGGIDVQISSVSSSGYTLLGLPATASNGFAAAATAGNTRRISQFSAVDPESITITNISQASSAVVSTSINPANYYVVGMKIHFNVPSSCGMVEMDQLTGTITAVNAVAASGNIGAYNVTVDINSTAFTAFAFPASSTSPNKQLFPTFAPAGASTTYNPLTQTYTGYDFNKQPFRTGQFVPYLNLAGGINAPAGQANDVINWIAYKLEN
jgi:hypothetical protein